MTRRRAIVVMGVSGAGKSALARRLADRFAVPFIEGDDHHSAENRRKMAGGTPLTDADRVDWLDSLADAMTLAIDREGECVVACSALRRAYRDRLRRIPAEISFVHLDVDRATLARRMTGRRGHFMPVALLDSQIATLEPPGTEEGAVVVDGTRPFHEILVELDWRLRLPATAPPAD